MKNLLLNLLKNAKSAINRDGFLPSLAFPLMPDNKTFEPIPLTFKDDEEKLKTFFALGAFCKENKIYDLILGLDSCYRQIPTNNKDREFFFKNLSTERPSLYPKNLRDNFILLQYIDFENEKNCANLTCKYRKKDKKNYFSKAIFRVNVESVIIKLVYDGWNASKII
jgi:hypothetical protein